MRARMLSAITSKNIVSPQSQQFTVEIPMGSDGSNKSW